MEQRTLGATEITVSKICLGTMTWSEQNTPEQAHAQLDYAVGHGDDFSDAIFGFESCRCPCFLAVRRVQNGVIQAVVSEIGIGKKFGNVVVGEIGKKFFAPAFRLQGKHRA